MDFLELINSPSWKGLGIVVSVITAAWAIVPRVTGYFSDFRNKARLRRDLELYKLTQEASVEAILIRERIDEAIQGLYKKRRRLSLPPFGNLMAGMIIFVGFTWWTYRLYANNVGFSPWMLMTGLLSIIGLSTVFDRTPLPEFGKNRKLPVFAIFIRSWGNALFNVTLVISSIWYGIQQFLDNGISGWSIAMLFLTVGAGYGFSRQFKLKRRGTFTDDDAF